MREREEERERESQTITFDIVVKSESHCSCAKLHSILHNNIKVDNCEPLTLALEIFLTNLSDSTLL